MGPNAGLELRILGQVQVCAGGEQIYSVSGRQARILAVLALSPNRVVAIGRIIDAVWDEDPPSTARRQVQNCVSALRRLTAAASWSVEVDGPGYRLQIAEDQLDAEAFHRQVALASDRPPQEAVQALRRALGLWHGPAMAGLSGRLIEAGAARLNEARLAAQERRLEMELEHRLAEPAELVSELAELAALYPLRERPVELMMRALHASGRQADALEAYQRLRSALGTELGIDPSEGLQALQAAVLRGETASAPSATVRVRTTAVPGQLPPAAGHFVGRTRELKGLDRLLEGDRESVVICAIAGTAGVGKTTLALHWAHQIAAGFPDGQLYVNLRGYDPTGAPMAPAEAIRYFLDGFGVPAERLPSGAQSQAALLRSLLAGRRVLMVLDNARDSAHVRDLLPGVPGCAVVVTSRDQLTGLVATQGAHHVTLGLMTAAEGRDLLCRKLSAERTEREPDATARLIELCAHLPLALAVVAARAAVQPHLDLAHFAGELAVANRRLDALDTGEDATRARAVFSWSYDRLAPAPAKLFRLLSLHPGPDISEHAAASLAGAALAEVRRELALLTQAHLLFEHLPGRYVFHDLLRDYAAELAQRIDSDEEHEAARIRLLDHYLHTAAGGAGHLRGFRKPLELPDPAPGVSVATADANTDSALQWWALERAGIVRAVEFAAATGAERHAWQLAWASAIYLDREGLRQEMEAVHRIALAAAGRLGDPRAEGYAYTALGRVCLRTGRLAEAHDLFAQAMVIAATEGDLYTLGRLHLEDGARHGLEQNYPMALEQAKLGVQTLSRCGDRAGEMMGRNAIGWYLAHLGRPQEALEHCEQALAWFREAHAPEFVSAILDSLGFIHRHLGNLSHARDCYVESVALHTDRHKRAVTLTGLGELLAEMGEGGQARQAWRQALEIFDSLGDTANAAKMRVSLAGVF